MPTQPNKSPADIRSELSEDLFSRMDTAPDACGYTREDIDRCLLILDSYMASISSRPAMSEDEIRGIVKQTVLDLSALDNKCGCCLIETVEREYICDLLLRAAQEAGLKTDEDITEGRDW